MRGKVRKPPAKKKAAKKKATKSDMLTAAAKGAGKARGGSDSTHENATAALSNQRAAKQQSKPGRAQQLLKNKRV